MSVSLRLADPADAGDVERIYAPIVRNTAISFEWEPPTRAELAARISETSSNGFPWLMADHDGAAVGYAYASSFRKRAAYDWSAEVSVYVAGEHRGRGAGRGLYGSLLRILTLQGYCNVYGVATSPNLASERLHEATGFQRIGTLPQVGYKFGAWHDVIVWWQRLRAAVDPPELMSIAEVRHHPEFRTALSGPGTSIP